nr:uncharacterized protein LOC125421335 [Ziziphus jujuba var. spinosa]
MSSSELIGSDPPKFDGSNYHLWAFKMQAYLEALNLWEAVVQDTNPPPLPDNPTLTQIKRHEELFQRKPKALTCIHQAVTNTVFKRIINIKSPKEVWNKLKLEFEELIGRLYAFEKRLSIKDDEEDNVEGAVQARHKSKQSKKDGKKPAKRSSDEGKGKGGTTQQANVIEEEKEEEPEVNVFLASQFLEADLHTWLVDSRCKSHMAKEESLFQSLDKSVKLKIRIGNGQVLEAGGRGTVLVQTKAGPRLIDEVLYVPSLSHNLLSVPQMLLNGYSILFKRNSCYIYDKKGSLTARLPMVNKSFMLNLNIQKEDACNVTLDESKLWHSRFGHFHYHALSKLCKEGMTRNTPEVMIPNEVCGVCQMGKQHRLPFPAEATCRAKNKLELIHSDLCGPMKNES